QQNKKDLEEIPADLLGQIRTHTVDNLEGALAFAFPKEKSPAARRGKSGTMEPYRVDASL
ncbi:MAG: hypothetical protein LBB66_10240, partial [Desulfovibrio sp.]|nr:hypothetical protein [Desulfovibrio sp.]